MVVVLDGLFLSPLPGFFVPQVSVDFPEEAGAVVPVDPDPAAPDGHRRGGDALPDVVFRVPDPKAAAPQLRLQGSGAGIHDDRGIPVAAQELLQVRGVFRVGFLPAFGR